MFNLYSADLEVIAKEHCVTIYSFADDTQLYLHCSRNDMTTTIARLQQCIVDISYWMSANRLKLNMDKTELLWAGTRRALSLCGMTAYHPCSSERPSSHLVNMFEGLG